jgi:N4-gp56 family major capsid protein
MAYTEVSSLNTVQAAYEQLAYFALRSELLFDQAADVQPTNQSMPGSSVVFTKFADLSAATSTLAETTDVTPVAMSDSQVTVTLAEYGNAINTTAKLRGTSFMDVDAAAANIIGYNAGDSLDQVVRDVLAAGTQNIFYGSGGASLPTSRATVGSDDIITANDVRKMTASLRKKNVATFNGYYMGFIHPDVSYDLRRETGNASWNAPHVNVDVAGIYNGEIGMFESVRFIETPRAKIFANASDGSGSSTGSSATVDVYCTHVMGRQSLAKAYSIVDGNGAFPKIVEGPVVDVLRRFNPTGWYWLGGYGRFREEALGRIESSSSIGAN